jgi:hypothetical protein
MFSRVLSWALLMVAPRFHIRSSADRARHSPSSAAMMSLEIICGASCRAPNRLAKARGVLLRARHAEYCSPQNPASRRSQSRRSQRERTHASCVEARPAIAALSSQAFALHEYCGAARATKTSQTKPPQGNFFSVCFCSDRAAQRVLLTRNGCATILSLIQPTRPVRLSNAQNKITDAAARLHRE